MAILPFLEQSTLYQGINQSTSIFALENTTIHTFRIATYACPSDPSAWQVQTLAPGELVPMSPDPSSGTWRMTPTSYAGATGSIDVVGLAAFYPGCSVPSRVRGQCDGIFADAVTVRPGDVTDGLSTTLLYGEKAITTFAQGGSGGSVPTQHGWWVSGNFDDSLFSAFYAPNAGRKVSAYGDLARYRSASSLHPGGVQVAMADGSVRQVADTVATWPFDGLTGQPVGATLDLDPLAHPQSLATPGDPERGRSRECGVLISATWV